MLPLKGHQLIVATLQGCNQVVGSILHDPTEMGNAESHGACVIGGAAAVATAPLV